MPCFAGKSWFFSGCPVSEKVNISYTYLSTVNITATTNLTSFPLSETQTGYPQFFSQLASSDSFGNVQLTTSSGSITPLSCDLSTEENETPVINYDELLLVLQGLAGLMAGTLVMYAIFTNI